MGLLSKLVMLPFIATVLVSPEVNIDYSGSVSPYDGSPVAEESEIVAKSVQLPDGSTYDRDSHTFNYSVSGYQGQVSSTVCNGMIVTDSVTITLPEEMDAILYCKGKEATDVDLAEITEPGSYSLVVSGQETDKQVLSFDIVSEKTGQITSYTLPEGFVIQTVEKDDVMQAPNYSRTVDLSAEGAYDIAYRCTSSGINYSLRVEIDHTLPTVEFVGINGSVANGPVTITGLAETDTVKVIFNDEEVNAPSNGVLRSVGSYRVTVFDDAGNSVSKDFTIRMYLNVQGIIFVALIVAVFIGVGVYMYVSRKRLRVR